MFISEPLVTYKIRQNPDSFLDNSITLIAGGCEMLRVAEDGFYVRSVKVTQDDKEAEIVYNAFKQFLTWAEMNRR
jgi:multisubunit Na+/H+ antiporter MnhE subunit